MSFLVNLTANFKITFVFSVYVLNRLSDQRTKPNFISDRILKSVVPSSPRVFIRSLHFTSRPYYIIYVLQAQATKTFHSIIVYSEQILLVSAHRNMMAGIRQAT